MDFLRSRYNFNAQVVLNVTGDGGECIVIHRKLNKENKNKININKNIRAAEVRLIDLDGNQVGIIPTYKALAIAADYGLDLVEVSPTAKPPVCRIMDYSRYKYEQTKKKAGSKKKAKHFSN